MFNLQQRSEENTNTKHQTVESTKDYSRFKLIIGNRVVQEGNTRSIEHQIARRGQTNPIVVNSQYEVIDGQHRLEACRRLGIPVKYIVEKSATIDDVVSTNIVGKKWTLSDFVHRYAAQGNNNYVKLQKLIAVAKSHGLPPGAAILIAQGGKSDQTYYMWSDGNICKHGSGRKAKKMYKVGNTINIGLYKMDNEAEIYERLNNVVLFKQYPFFKNSLFVSALLQVMRIDAFDIERLLFNAQKYPSRFTNEPDVNGFVTMFEKVYNYRNKKKLPLVNNPQRRK